MARNCKQKINLKQQSFPNETRVNIPKVKRLLKTIRTNIKLISPPADPTFVYLNWLSNNGLYHKFRTEKEEAWTNAIQSVLLKPEEYPIKLTMLKHNATSNYILKQSYISSSVCDDIVLPFAYIIDFAKELKEAIPKEETEKQDKYLERIAELVYRSLNGITIDDKYKENQKL